MRGALRVRRWNLGAGARYSRKALGSALALGCLLGLALLSKLSALALVALTGLTLLLAAWRARSWRTLIVNSLAVGLPALAIAGWWYGRNWALYRDPLAWNVWQANILLRVIPAGWRNDHRRAGQPGALLLGALRLAERALSGVGLHRLPRVGDRVCAGPAAARCALADRAGPPEPAGVRLALGRRLAVDPVVGAAGILLGPLHAHRAGRAGTLLLPRRAIAWRCC